MSSKGSVCRERHADKRAPCIATATGGGNVNCFINGRGRALRGKDLSMGQGNSIKCYFCRPCSTLCKGSAHGLGPVEGGGCISLFVSVYVAGRHTGCKCNCGVKAKHLGHRGVLLPVSNGDRPG